MGRESDTLSNIRTISVSIPKNTARSLNFTTFTNERGKTEQRKQLYYYVKGKSSLSTQL